MEELEKGRLWKARDRVTGLFSSDPTNPEVLRLAGEVYFRMGDLPRSGAFWFLTDLSGEEVDAAISALGERYPNPQELAAVLPIRDRIETYPAAARERLEALQRAVSNGTGHEWDPGPRTRRDVPPRSTNRLAGFVFFAVVLVLLTMLGVGFITIIRSVGSAFQ